MFDSSLYTLVSSGNILNVEEMLEDMSLTQIRNKIGPRIVPWGTPDVAQDQDEWVPRRTTRCLRSVRKLLKQRSKEPSIPWHFNLSRGTAVREAQSQTLLRNLKIYHQLVLIYFLMMLSHQRQHSSWVKFLNFSLNYISCLDCLLRSLSHRFGVCCFNFSRTWTSHTTGVLKIPLTVYHIIWCFRSKIQTKMTPRPVPII